MYTTAIILPLDVDGKLYSLQDEKGKTIGTGTRAMCEVLLSIISRPSASATPVRSFYIGSRSGGTTMLVPHKPKGRVR